MSKYLWSRLVLPLLTAFSLCILLHLWWSADGFFINLATTFLGIVFTVAYVDWVLREQDRRRWQVTDVRVVDRLKKLTCAIVSGIRRGLGYGPEVMNIQISESHDTNVIDRKILYAAEHILAPNLHSCIRRLDQNGWRNLAQQIRYAHDGVTTILNAFQGRLNPDQIAQLLDLEAYLTKSMTMYSIFPDIAGVPLNQLPSHTTTPPEQLQEAICQSAAEELRKVLAVLKSFSETLRP